MLRLGTVRFDQLQRLRFLGRSAAAARFRAARRFVFGDGHRRFDLRLDELQRLLRGLRRFAMLAPALRPMRLFL